jgi:lysozyme
MRLVVLVALAGCAVAGGQQGVPGSALDPGTISGADGQGDAYGLRRCAQQGMVLGVDVSSYQGTVDWKQAQAAGVRFAFVRVSDGLDVKDELFASNWAGVEAANIVRGAYQYFRPDEDPLAQADLLADAIGQRAPGDLPPALIVEQVDRQTPAQIAAAVRAWAARIQNRLGVFPIIYTGSEFWHDEVGNMSGGAYPLWIAEYDTDCPTIPTAWTGWAFWQSASGATVPGIPMPVDVDRFNGTEADLAQAAR